ncbi:MAG: hypothetical protein RR552_02165 [Oscillospiraceae bacterium]
MKKFICVILCGALLLCGGFSVYKYVNFEVFLESDKNGTLTVETQTVKPFETVKVHILPSRTDGYYVLEKLIINGVDMTKDVKLNAITLKRVHEDIEVKATFKKTNPPITSPSFI